MFDGKDDDNIWHSAYNAHGQNDNNGHHYIKLNTDCLDFHQPETTPAL